MRGDKPWRMVVVVLTACVGTRGVEEQVDAAQRSAPEECVASKGTGACTEDGLSEEAGKVTASDAGIVDWSGGGGCEYLSQYFDGGVSFPSNDGCNTCECFGGRVTCSLVGCGGRPAHCDLPFDPGPCDEAHAYYAHNPSTGLCEAVSYSGCGGNLNRFEEYGTCAYRCSLSPGPGQSCTYDGQTYRHRERVARKPSEMTGCGPCLCNDGHVLCPPEDCKCPDAHKLGLQCVGCNSTGGCSDWEERCFPVCDTDADCDTTHGVFCDKAQGLCVSKPGCL